MTGAKWQQRRSFWTWGYESDEPDAAARKLAAANISKRLGRVVTPPPIPRLEDVTLRDARLKVPAALQDWVSSSHVERALHTHGGHVLELLAGLRGEFTNPPDAVAHPRNEAELEATLAWCDSKGYAVIPFGGATSVVWGVCVPENVDAAVTLSLIHISEPTRPY